MKCEKWLRIALTVTVMAVAFSLFFLVMMLITGAEWTGSADEVVFIVSMLPNYLMLGCGLFTLVMGITTYVCYLPVCVSFGCTRRDAVIGLQIVERLPAMLCTLIAAAICFVVKTDVTRDFLKAWPIMFCMLWIAGSVSGITGSLGVRFGRIAKVISVIIFMLCGMAGGFAGGISAGGGLPDISFGGDAIATLGIVLGAVAVVSWIVELIVSTRILRKYEVKM